MYDFPETRAEWKYFENARAASSKILKGALIQITIGIPAYKNTSPCFYEWHALTTTHSI